MTTTIHTTIAKSHESRDEIIRLYQAGIITRTEARQQLGIQNRSAK